MLRKILQNNGEDYMKNLGDFFENTNFEFINEKALLEKNYQEIWEKVYLPSQQKKILEY